MTIGKSASVGAVKLVAGLLAGSLCAAPAFAQSNRPAQGGASGLPATKEAPAATGAPARKVSPYRPEKLTKGAEKYFAAAWGVDKMKVSYTQSGTLIRFTYRVSDPDRAQVLGDKKATPYLYGHRSSAVLQTPVMDKVGQLRQTGTPVAGQEYWMVFSNKGNLVKPGDRVTVVVGSFRADGLTVE